MNTTEVGDRLLKRIRIAETSPRVTRIVLDLESAADFSVSRLENPSRFIIELRPVGANSPAQRTQVAQGREMEPARTEPAPFHVPGQPGSAGRGCWLPPGEAQ